MTNLSREQRLEFLSNGYLVIQPTAMSAEDHAFLWQKADEQQAMARGRPQTAHLEVLGDNVRAAIPEIDRMLGDPAVQGAVQSLLGERAQLHPHHFLHQSQPSDQPFHQDGNLPWNERGHYRSHRPDWLILFYYPQAVTLDNGPTEILPGTQYWTTDIEHPDGTWRSGDPIDPDLRRSTLADADLAVRDEVLAASVAKLAIPDLERRFVQVPAGSVVIGNYDLIHRGSRTLPEQAPRYMFKFYYARTQEPAAQDGYELPSLEGLREDLKPIVTSIWAWTDGSRYRAALSAQELTRCGQALREGRENEKVAAAYRLGADTSAASLDVLVSGLHHEAESVRRASAYGLRQRCDEAGDALETALGDEQASVRRFAAFALGAAWSPGAEALIERLGEEPDDLARSNMAYALGQIARNSALDTEEMLTALIDRLLPGAEPDNTGVAGLSRSTVRESAAYAVLLAASNHALSDEVRSALAELLLTETDRYVFGMLAEALAVESADGDALRALNARRWSMVPRSEAGSR